MIINNYNFFKDEFQKYKNALLAYKSKSQVFIDENFHPTANIQEKTIDLDDSTIIWKRVDDIYPAPLFKKELIHHEYIQQGEIGDCYFITALMRIAKQPHLVEPLFEKEQPDAILGKVPESINIKCGAVVVYFRAFGRRTPVLIDTLIPTRYGEPIFNRLINDNKSPWSLLVEKAYAKLNGCYSNIDGGFFFDSIYSLYGYYNKAIYFFNKESLDVKKTIQKILKFQHYGCIMDASINETNEVDLNEIDEHNLVTKHSYLILKIRKFEEKIFFLLFNPWGHKIWIGDYSSDSDLWKPELKEALKNEPEKGHFWMIDRDFFHYFNEIDVAKPLDPHWTVRLFECKLKQLTDCNKMQNFAFQITDSIPDGQKFHFHLLVERRITDYSKYYNRTYIYVIYAHNDGKKLQNETDKKTFSYQKVHGTVTFTFDVCNNDIVTFIIYKLNNPDVEEKCYIRAFCKYDFKLYDINSPDKLFPKCENTGAAFDNFTITAPTSALPLKETIVDSKTAFWFDKNIGKNDNSLSDIMKINYEKVNFSHYSNQGTQISLDTFIFNNEKLMIRPKFVCYLVNEKKKGKEFVAYVSRLPTSIVLKVFSEQLSIQRNIKYPSILNYYGYNERNFKHDPYPVLILEFCKRGTLSEVLSFQNNCELEKKGFSDWNNTKKMINLIGVALGMNYLHKHNIIHRSLRCLNVFLDENLYPKIGGFDGSKMFSSELNHVDFDGPDYCIAPEYINDDEPYSFPIDVFAYGMLFYHIITNKEPTIPHFNIGKLYSLIVKGERPTLELVPIKYHQFISNLWNKDQNKRPTFENIIDTLLNNQEQLWLDDVDKNEVEFYLHHFGMSIFPKKEENSLKNLYRFINKIDINNLKMISYQQIIAHELISYRLINDIKKADEIINNNRINDNHTFLFRIGVELSNKLPNDCFNGLKYLKASAICGNENAILFIIRKLCLNANLIDIGIELAKQATESDIIESFLFMADLYMNGKYGHKNIVLAAIYFKIAADKGNIIAMNQYANIITKIAHLEENTNDYQQCVKNATKVIFENHFANKIIFIKARQVFDMIENDEASFFVAKKYYERAAQEGNEEADKSLKLLIENHIFDDNVPQYFNELC